MWQKRKKAFIAESLFLYNWCPGLNRTNVGNVCGTTIFVFRKSELPPKLPPFNRRCTKTTNRPSIRSVLLFQLKEARILPSLRYQIRTDGEGGSRSNARQKRRGKGARRALVDRLMAGLVSGPSMARNFRVSFAGRLVCPAHVGPKYGRNH